MIVEENEDAADENVDTQRTEETEPEVVFTDPNENYEAEYFGDSEPNTQIISSNRPETPASGAPLCRQTTLHPRMSVQPVRVPNSRPSGPRGPNFASVLGSIASTFENQNIMKMM